MESKADLDIGTAIFRHNDPPFDRLVFVAGSEQQYHFKVLFTILAKLGFGWTENLYHLSYDMVNLPEGCMKSREGTVVDADDLIDSLKDMALEEIREKERTDEVGDPEEVAEKIALGALHYYLLQVSAAKDMLFNPKESLSFNGNTGPTFNIWAHGFPLYCARFHCRVTLIVIAEKRFLWTAALLKRNFLQVARSGSLSRPWPIIPEPWPPPPKVLIPHFWPPISTIFHGLSAAFTTTAPSSVRRNRGSRKPGSVCAEDSRDFRSVGEKRKYSRSL
jgi:hypothetical protein